VGIGALNLTNQTICLIATAVFGFGLGLVFSSHQSMGGETAGTRRRQHQHRESGLGRGSVSLSSVGVGGKQSHQLEILLLGLAGLALLHAVARVNKSIATRSRK
jgi:hypothetical protein